MQKTEMPSVSSMLNKKKNAVWMYVIQSFYYIVSLDDHENLSAIA